MCIRDRSYAAFKLEFDNPTGTLDSENVLTVAGALAQLQNCLLYTSDAADDLLCVDLGGRRIIKKKKNTRPATDNLQHSPIHLVTETTQVFRNASHSTQRT